MPEPEVNYEQMLDECLSPYELGRQAGSIALEHLAKFGFIAGNGDILRQAVGEWVVENIADEFPHQMDLGIAVINITARRVTVRLYDNAKTKTGPSRVCLPAGRAR